MRHEAIFRYRIEWLGPVLIVLAVQWIAAIAISFAVGFEHGPPVSVYGLVSVMVAIAATAVFAVSRLRSLPPSPFNHLRHHVRWGLLLELYLGLALVTQQFALVNWMKGMIPFVTTYWADPYLAVFDHALVGADWLTLFPQPDAGTDMFYRLWFPAVLCVLAWVLLSSSSRKGPLILSWFLIIGGGCALGQYLLPSAGPVFYQRLGFGDRYSSLELPEFAKFATDYLWAQYQIGGLNVGTGMSAFPSGHVASAFWMVLVAWYLWRPLVPLAVAYWLAIFVGSITLGWHYAADGIFGSLLAFASLKVAERLLKERLEPVREAEIVSA